MADDGKMTALKTATKNLLTQLKNAAIKDGDVYVSIIPFSKDVNVGSSNYQKNWVRWDLWDALNGTCSNKWYTGKSSCENAGKTWRPINSGVAMMPKATVHVDGDDAIKVLKLLDAIEELDDVQKVYSNVDVDESILAQVEA